MSVDETLMCSFKKIKPGDKKKFGGATAAIKNKPNSAFGKKYMSEKKFSR